MGDSILPAFWVMVFLQTLGSVDMPGSGERKMPAPRVYIAPLVIFGVLQMVADAGAERAAAAVAWVTVLTSLVVGPFGSKLTGFINGIVNIVAIPPVAGAPTVGSGPTLGPGPGSVAAGTNIG